jgi:hypothetical protein
MPRVATAIALIAAFALGAALRLDQITAQVLQGDEWHLVHQLTYYRPSYIALNLGVGDYGIPLALFDAAVMRRWPLSELVLRLPMLVAGLLTVVLLPIGLAGRTKDRVRALFALLLAISPFLISYSRLARTYALTLLVAYLAYALFAKATADAKVRWGPALGYGLACGLGAWLHAIVVPMLGAPVLARGLAEWRAPRPNWRPLAAAAIPAAIAVVLALAPPLLAHTEALSAKWGVDRVGWDTVWGALFLWFGTGSNVVFVVCLVLAVAGFGPVWRDVEYARWGYLGTALTVVVILVARPWWVDKPLAFGRYLLPVVPLLLLCVAAGAVRVSDRLATAVARDRGRAVWTLAVAAPLVAALWAFSPMPEQLRYPNSYTQDVYFQYDYREATNAARVGAAGISNSPFWATLASAPAGSLTIAVAPFHYATWEWPAAIWERDSRQRVVPAYLWGACVETRHGEVPPDRRFAFRNAVHLRNPEELVRRRIDYLAYFRPTRLPGMSEPLPACEAWVREHYGPPDYADDVLWVWRIRPVGG